MFNIKNKKVIFIDFEDDFNLTLAVEKKFCSSDFFFSNLKEYEKNHFSVYCFFYNKENYERLILSISDAVEKYDIKKDKIIFYSNQDDFVGNDKFITINSKTSIDLTIELQFYKLSFDKSVSLLSKFYSKSSIEEKINKNELEDNDLKHISGYQENVSIMVIDIRNSVRISENIDPKLFTEFLNHFYTDVLDLIYSYNGFVNKFIGDGILAVFGCPSDKDSAYNAVQSGNQILEHLKSLNEYKPDYIKDDIKIGIGIATGKVFAGELGSIYNSEFSFFGDTVNLASRLESMTKKMEKKLIFCEKTNVCISQENRYQINKGFIFLDEVEVIGRSKKIGIYTLT